MFIFISKLSSILENIEINGSMSTIWVNMELEWTIDRTKLNLVLRDV